MRRCRFDMTHITIIVQPCANKTTQSAFALNLAALLHQAGASVSVQQESGKFHSAKTIEKMIPANPQADNTEVLIELKGQ